MKRIALICLCCALGASVSQAAVLQLSLTPEIALEPRTEHIYGLSLNIWGDNPQTGIALGGMNYSSGESAGVSLALLLNKSSTYNGIQLGLLNTAKYLAGIQLGAVNNAGYDLKGIQAGLINFNSSFNFWHGGDSGKLSGIQIGVFNMEREMNGVQMGVINLSSTTNGLQAGAFNYSENLTGVQIGVFNRAKELNGLQLGVFNWVDTNPWFTETPDKLARVFPLINWSF